MSEARIIASSVQLASTGALGRQRRVVRGASPGSFRYDALARERASLHWLHPHADPSVCYSCFADFAFMFVSLLLLLLLLLLCSTRMSWNLLNARTVRRGNTLSTLEKGSTQIIRWAREEHGSGRAAAARGCSVAANSVRQARRVVTPASAPPRNASVAADAHATLGAPTDHAICFARTGVRTTAITRTPAVA